MSSRTNVRRWLPLSVLAVAIIVTLIASYYVRASNLTRDRLRFSNYVSTTSRGVDEKIDDQVRLLRASAAFLASSEAVTHEDFRRFVASLDLAREYPGVLGIGFSLRVPTRRVDSLNVAMRAAGVRDFTVHPYEGSLSEHHSIIYLEPMNERNRNAIGFDMFSEATRREAMSRARDSGDAATTRRVRLRQEIDSNVQAGFLVYYPVYAGSPRTVDERRRMLRGFVYSPLRGDDLFTGITEAGEERRVDLQVYDTLVPAPERLIHDSRRTRRDDEAVPSFSDTVAIDVPGARWGLVVSTRPEFDALSGLEQVPLVFIAGVLLSIVLFVVTRSEAIAREEAERTAASLARSEEALRASEGRFRAIFNQAAVGIAEIDPGGRFVMVNRRFSEILGYAPHELDRIAYTDLTHPEDIAVSRENVSRLLTTGESFNLLKRYLHKDGHIVWGIVSASLLRDASGAPAKIVVVVEDVTARQQAEAALRESELRLRSLVESNIFGVASGEYGGAISYANDYFLEMLGYDRAALEAGTIRWDSLAAPSDRDIMRVATARLARTGVVEPLEAEFVRSDGRVVPTLIGSALLGETLTSGSRIIAFCLDLTERRRAEAELRAAKEAAEAANFAKDRFLAVLSHELRTPLTPVMAALEAFDGSEMSEDLRMILEIVRRNVGLEARLIDDLLDLTRIVNGKLQLFPEPVDAHRLIREALAMVDEIPTKRLSVVVRLDADDHIVRGDSARLQQVLWNLVRNAARYTPAGGAIDILTRNRDGRLEIEVRDNGMGIAAEDLERIFNAFEQGENTGQRHGGLGLGLAISRMLVELHGGSIRAASEGRGRGAQFFVDLPVERTQTPSVPSSEESMPAAPARAGARVLLVEDHLDTRSVLEVLLRQYGYRVATADCVATALAAADEPFDVLVSDIGLPDGSGYDLLRTLRERMPVRAVALSGFGMEDDVRRSREAGFAEHLTKPVDIRRLHEVIDTLLDAEPTHDRA